VTFVTFFIIQRRNVLLKMSSVGACWLCCIAIHR